MTGIDDNNALAVLVVLIPLLGVGVLLWQRTTAEGRKMADWRGRVNERLKNVEKQLEKLDKLQSCVQDIRLQLVSAIDRDRRKNP